MRPLKELGKAGVLWWADHRCLGVGRLECLGQVKHSEYTNNL